MNKVRMVAALVLTLLMLWGCYPEVPTAESTEDTGTIATTKATETTEKAEPTTGSEPSETTEATVPSPVTEPTQPSEPEIKVPPEEDFVRVAEYIPDIQVGLAYATVDNFTGQRIYAFEDAYLRYGTVKKLLLVQQDLAQYGLGLKIWDGYRPLSAQERLWEICPDPRFVSNPKTGTRSHCRGSAVDVTLIDLNTGEELEMPSGFDEFSAQGDRDYSDCTAEAAANAALLEKIMVRYGFKPYSAEWWHYSDTDSYPVEETFEPPVTADTGNLRD